MTIILKSKQRKAASWWPGVDTSEQVPLYPSVDHVYLTNLYISQLDFCRFVQSLKTLMASNVKPKMANENVKMKTSLVSVQHADTTTIKFSKEWMIMKKKAYNQTWTGLERSVLPTEQSVKPAGSWPCCEFLIHPLAYS